MVQSKEDVLKQLSSAKNSLFQKYRLKSLGLFGSFARGSQTPQSDVDLLFESTEPLGMEVVDMCMEIEKLLGRRVEVVSRKAIKKRMRSYIDKDVIYV